MITGGATISARPASDKGFALATPGIRIAPSLLAADFSRLREETARVESAGVELMHLDVMDGHFVPNLSYGIPVIESLRPCTKLFFDAHLMIEDPVKYSEPFVKAGCDHITFHVEVTDKPREVVDHIRSLGVSVGVSINPATPADAISEIIDDVDMVLVMSIWPGFGGQKFMKEVLAKTETIRDRLAPHQRLEMDGGINAETITSAAAAGVDVFVAGTAVFRADDPQLAIASLHEAATQSYVGRSDQA